MSKVLRLRPEFVERLPKTLEDGVIYISKKYSTAAHLCCCGCRAKIVTPLKPGQWELTLSDERVSIHPSIGNWSSTCQSHYWIESNQVNWTRGYSLAEIAANRAGDKYALRVAHAARPEEPVPGLLRRVWNWIKRLF